MISPYKLQPDHAFWSKAVSSGYCSAHTLQIGELLIRNNEKVASAGSCFAANIIPYIENAGFEYVRTEGQNPVFCGIDEEDFAYSKFSAGYGNIYTPRQFLQLINRANGSFCPAEDRWPQEEGIVDPFRPGLKFKAKTVSEFNALHAQHLRNTLKIFKQADVFVLTLGLTEAWQSKIDGAVFPVCPGTLGGQFDASSYEFKNYNVQEIVDDLTLAICLARAYNSKLRFILTVSPIPLVATATKEHVLTATIYSKSVLRVAAEEVSTQLRDVIYFPSYEIATGPQAPKDFFEADKRSISKHAVDEIMNSFFSHCEIENQPDGVDKLGVMDRNMELSSRIVDAECEELMLDR